MVLFDFERCDVKFFNNKLWTDSLLRDIETCIKSFSVRYVGACDICPMDYHIYNATKNNAGKSRPGDIEEFKG